MLYQLIFSPTGGVEKVARAVTGRLGPDFKTVDLCSRSDDFSRYSFGKDDIAVIALPSYGGRVPALAAERLRKIHGSGARCVLVCVYGNRAYEDTLAEMEDIARECGFVTVAAISAVAEHSIAHQYAAGRPDEADAAQLEGFAEKIREKLDSGAVGGLHIPGNRPYKKAGGGGLVPKAADECVKCGLCAKQCPACAIDSSNPKTTDGKKCISCMRCVVRCPKNARKVNGVMLSAVSLALKKACSERKDCELFI